MNKKFKNIQTKQQIFKHLSTNELKNIFHHINYLQDNHKFVIFL